MMTVSESMFEELEKEKHERKLDSVQETIRQILSEKAKSSIRTLEAKREETILEAKRNILGLTNDIIKTIYSEPNVIFIKTKLNEVVKELSIISSYADSTSHNLREFNLLTMQISVSIWNFKRKERWDLVSPTLALWCSAVNSIEFDIKGSKRSISIGKLEFNFLKNSISGLKNVLDM